MIRARELKMGKPYAEKEFVPIAQAQREKNCALGLPSVKKEGIRDAKVAIVGYGPSLVDTVFQLSYRQREFDAIWCCSKAHDFLIERGIVPTHHTDTDYREHKVGYNRLWQPTTRYFMATQVHPSYFDALKGLNVSLFHVVQPGGGTFDNRYMKLPVAFDAGSSVVGLAYELGYRNQEWFGMDASARMDKMHAGAHGGLKQEVIDVEIAGETRQMSDFFLRQALFLEQALHDRPKLWVQIHGDGALKPLLIERGRVKANL